MHPPILAAPAIFDRAKRPRSLVENIVPRPLAMALVRLRFGA
jgi:hypothetical protein